MIIISLEIKTESTRRITNTSRARSSNETRILFASHERLTRWRANISSLRNSSDSSVKRFQLQVGIWYGNFLNSSYKAFELQSAGALSWSIEKLSSIKYFNHSSDENSVFLNIFVYVFLIVIDTNPFTVNCATLVKRLIASDYSELST